MHTSDFTCATQVPWLCHPEVLPTLALAPVLPLEMLVGVAVTCDAGGSGKTYKVTKLSLRFHRETCEAKAICGRELLHIKSPWKAVHDMWQVDSPVRTINFEMLKRHRQAVKEKKKAMWAT